jgi:hypothetical protein
MTKSLLAFAISALIPASIAFAQWSSDPMVNLAIAKKQDDQVQPKIRATSDGGCYISWFDNDPNGNPPFGYDVFLQRLDENGVRQWRSKGLRVADLGMSSTQDYGLDIDRRGNALIAFLDDRHPPDTVVTAAKVSPDALKLWGPDGLHPSSGSDFKGNPKIAATSDGFAVIAWINGNNIVLQRVNGAGAPQWGSTGITLTAPAGSTYSVADLHGSDAGSVIVSWVSAAGFSSPKHLLANKLDTTGALLWGASHVVVFDGGSLQFGNFPPFVTDGAGGAVFGWYQVDPLQSRAQHILADGSEAFPHNGSLGSTDTSHDQVNPSVSYDPATTSTYLFWDEILEGPLTNEGISAQKFNATGTAQWSPTGVVVQPFTSSAVISVTSVFTSTGALVVWSSEPAFAQDTIMGARLDESGTLTCPPFAVSSRISSKSRLDLTFSSATGDALAVWSDGRSDGGDIYGQNINSDCSLGL